MNYDWDYYKFGFPPTKYKSNGLTVLESSDDDTPRKQPTEEEIEQATQQETEEPEEQTNAPEEDGKTE